MAIPAKKQSAEKEDSTNLGGKKVRLVRGGGICAAGDKKPALVKGSLHAAMCVSTPGPDPRPRWRAAGQSR